MAVPPSVVPVVHEYVVVVHIGVATDTDSPEPKPVIEMVPAIACSGNPKLLPVALNETFGVMLNGDVTVLVPSDTTMLCAPPGRAGVVTVVLNVPEAVVVRQALPPPMLPV
jgi:hypothetical protein